MTKPHKGRWVEGKNCLDIHVTMRDGSSVSFTQKKGGEVSEDALRHALRALAVLVGIESEEREPWVDAAVRDGTVV